MSSSGKRKKRLSWLRHQEHDSEDNLQEKTSETTEQAVPECTRLSGEQQTDSLHVPLTETFPEGSCEEKKSSHPNVDEFSPASSWSQPTSQLVNLLLNNSSGSESPSPAISNNSVSATGVQDISPSSVLQQHFCDSARIPSPPSLTEETHYKNPPTPPERSLLMWREHPCSFTESLPQPYPSPSFNTTDAQNFELDHQPLPSFESIQLPILRNETVIVKRPDIDSSPPSITDLSSVIDVPPATHEVTVETCGPMQILHPFETTSRNSSTPHDYLELNEWITLPSLPFATESQSTLQLNPPSHDWTTNACYIDNVPIMCSDIPYFVHSWTPVPFPESEQTFGLPMGPSPNTIQDNQPIASYPNYEYESYERPPTPTIHDFPDLLTLQSPATAEASRTPYKQTISRQCTSPPATDTSENPVQHSSAMESLTLQEAQTQQVGAQQNTSDSGPIDFALWALKSLLPNGKQLKDKGSILHATSDYIERLQGEIKQYLKQLGIKDDEEFWASLRQNPSTNSQSRTKKKKKPQEDEIKVRRPPNAFIRFSVEFRRMVANDFPGRNNREVSQMLGSIWRKMSTEEKAPFVNATTAVKVLCGRCSSSPYLFTLFLDNYTPDVEDTQFYEELKQTRQDHPDWNYAGLQPKRFCLDPAETKPERLRPRNVKQQVSYKDLLQRRYMKHKPVKKKKEESEKGENKPSVKPKQVFWVQCDECNKWRKLPASVDSEQLPEKWVCFMNSSRDHNSCDQAEEME